MTKLHRKCRISYLCEKKKTDKKVQSSKPTEVNIDTSSNRHPSLPEYHHPPKPWFSSAVWASPRRATDQKAI